MEKVVHGEEDCRREAARFSATLTPRARGATLVTLSGELGAGKTTFAQGIARSLGIKESITSPTFVLLKRYLLPPGQAFQSLVHIDAYRLTSARELTPLHLEEVFVDAKNLVLLEWPEKVSSALPIAAVAVTLHVLPGRARRITYRYE